MSHPSGHTHGHSPTRGSGSGAGSTRTSTSPVLGRVSAPWNGGAQPWAPIPNPGAQCRRQLLECSHHNSTSGLTCPGILPPAPRCLLSAPCPPPCTGTLLSLRASTIIPCGLSQLGTSCSQSIPAVGLWHCTVPAASPRAGHGQRGPGSPPSDPGISPGRGGGPRSSCARPARSRRAQAAVPRRQLHLGGAASFQEIPLSSKPAWHEYFSAAAWPRVRRRVCAQPPQEHPCAGSPLPALPPARPAPPGCPFPCWVTPGRPLLPCPAAPGRCQPAEPGDARGPPPVRRRRVPVPKSQPGSSAAAPSPPPARGSPRAGCAGHRAPLPARGAALAASPCPRRESGSAERPHVCGDVGGTAAGGNQCSVH